MRLTLRTMLAYLDDILEANDADELRQKIEKSADATKLVHRIRNSVARMRLGSPKMMGQGMGADPNTVAEYLDNTLPADRVPEMERVCLDSDMHLAEVAASHQILALVLGEPARVEPSLRQRVYALGRLPAEALTSSSADPAASNDPDMSMMARIVPSTGERLRVDMVAAVRDATLSAGNGATSSPVPVPLVAPIIERERPVVPEYLRDDRKNRPYAILVIALLGGFVLTAGAMLVIDRTYGIGRLIGLGPDGQLAEADPEGRFGPTGSQAPPENELAGAALSGESRGDLADSPAGDANLPPTTDLESGEFQPNAAAEPGDRGDQWQADTPDGDQALEGGVGPNDVGPMPLPGNELPPDLAPSNQVPTDVRGAPGVDNGASLADAPPSPPMDEPVVTTPDDTSATGTETDDLSQGEISSDGAAESTTDEVVAADPGNSEIPTGDKTAVQVGRVSSHEQVLAYMDEAADTWYRLPERGPVVVGQHLCVMPTFRPQFLLIPSAIQVTAIEGTCLQVMEPLDDHTPVFQAERARLILMPYQQAGGQVALSVGGQLVTIFLGDLNTVVAVQADHVMAPGTDPTSESRIPVSRIWVMGGHARVSTAEHPAHELGDGQQLIVVERRAGQFAEGVAPPRWMDTKSISDIDRRVAPELELRMRDERPLALVLAELAEDAKVRVDKRSLADRCLASLGSFDSLVRSLRDETLYSAWPYHFDELRVALERGPDESRRVHDSFRRVFGADGDALFRLMWGYSTEQLEGGESAKLVEYLAHQDVAYRVLGFENLRRITGANLYYQPQNSEVRRRQSLGRWRDKLAQGGIAYDKEPEWLPAGPEGAKP